MNTHIASSWANLTQTQKVLRVLATIGDVAGKLAAWHLLYHRPAATFRGPKWLWTLVVTLIGGVGPLTFFLFARKK